MDFSGQVVLVTGAGQGIGRAIALRLARAGADVVVNDIVSDTLERVAAEIEVEGVNSLALVADVSDADSVTRMFDELSAVFGRLDILVNNAGIGPIHSLLECSEAEWDRVFDINAKGTFLCSKAAARQMISQGSGKIINAASVAAIRAAANFVPYCASKAAVRLLTQGLALELAEHNITVNAYCPGIIDSAMTTNTNITLARRDGISTEDVVAQRENNIPLGHTGTPEDVAAVVEFLASDASNYITGQCISIDGGLVMR